MHLSERGLPERQKLRTGQTATFASPARLFADLGLVPRCELPCELRCLFRAAGDLLLTVITIDDRVLDTLHQHKTVLVVDVHTDT